MSFQCIGERNNSSNRSQCQNIIRYRFVQLRLMWNSNQEFHHFRKIYKILHMKSTVKCYTSTFCVTINYTTAAFIRLISKNIKPVTARKRFSLINVNIFVPTTIYSFINWNIPLVTCPRAFVIPHNGTNWRTWFIVRYIIFFKKKIRILSTTLKRDKFYSGTIQAYRTIVVGMTHGG